MSNSDNIDNQEAVKLEACPFCGNEPVRVSIGTATCNGMVDGREVHNTISMRPKCWNARPATLTPAKLDAPDNQEALALIGRVRERYPTDGVGPITLQQRNDILEVCDIAEATMTTRPAGVEEVERAKVVAFLRDQADIGADYGIASEKGTTRRAAYGGGSLALDRAAGAIQRGDHLAIEAAPLPSPEQGPPCENCGQPVQVGQVVLPWEEPGEMHADCDHPYSLDVTRGEDEPEPVVLLGEPMIHFPLAALTKPAALPKEGEEAAWRWRYVPSDGEPGPWIIRHTPIEPREPDAGGSIEVQPLYALSSLPVSGEGVFRVAAEVLASARDYVAGVATGALIRSSNLARVHERMACNDLARIDAVLAALTPQQATEEGV